MSWLRADYPLLRALVSLPVSALSRRGPLAQSDVRDYAALFEAL